MNYTLTIGKETISLLNTVKPFKIGKLEMIQKWYVKNEEELRAIEHDKSKANQVLFIKATQQKLIGDMNLIKASSIHEGQGRIWDTKVYNDFQRKNVIVTQEIDERDKLNNLINSIDAKVTTLYIVDFLKGQSTDVLLRFLKPIVKHHSYDLVELKTH